MPTGSRGVRDQVQASYAEYARKGGDGTGNLEERATSWGYDRALFEEAGLRDEATLATIMAAACGGGCPFAAPFPARAQTFVPGQRVVDLGCGAGHDCLLAARLVGAKGLVVGVDLTPEMVAAAAAACAEDAARARSGTANSSTGSNHGDKVALGGLEVAPSEFHVAALDDGTLFSSCGPLAHLAGTFDVALSNGVLNLCDDKPAAFAAVFRALKPGGVFLLCDVCVAPRGCGEGDGAEEENEKEEAKAADEGAEAVTATVPQQWPPGKKAEGSNAKPLLASLSSSSSVSSSPPLPPSVSSGSAADTKSTGGGGDGGGAASSAELGDAWSN